MSWPQMPQGGLVRAICLRCRSRTVVLRAMVYRLPRVYAVGFMEGNPRTVVVGPNHALHGVLTLFTFWACGGWAWVWLLVALRNRKQMAVVDERGRVVRPGSDYQWIGAVFVDDDGRTRWGSVAAVVGVIVFVVMVAAIINL